MSEKNKNAIMIILKKYKENMLTDEEVCTLLESMLVETQNTYRDIIPYPIEPRPWIEPQPWIVSNGTYYQTSTSAIK